MLVIDPSAIALPHVFKAEQPAGKQIVQAKIIVGASHHWKVIRYANSPTQKISPARFYLPMLSCESVAPAGALEILPAVGSAKFRRTKISFLI
jgi:hypothetical protein